MQFSPQPKCVTVKLDTSPYQTISTEKGEFDSSNTGLVVDFGQYPELEDAHIIWQQFKEKETTFTHEGDQYAIIEYEYIRGVDEA